MPRGRYRVFVCCLLLVLVGCAGGPSTDGRTPSATPTTASTTDGPPSAVPDDANVVDYANLSRVQQRAVDDALGSEVDLLDGGAWGTPDRYYSYGAVVDDWPGESVSGRANSERYVRRNDTYYEVTFGALECCTGPATGLGLEAVDSPGNRSVVDAANLSERPREFVAYAVEQERAGAGSVRGWRVDLPVVTGDVIEYRGRYYEVTSVSTADFGTASMRALALGDE
jgi:hypothetical protein